MCTNNLSYRGRQFYIGEEPIQLISGAIHYFRMLPKDWYDRLYKLKACGFNTVETYIPWNLHEPEENEFNFTGLANFEKFISIADSLDLLVILRPSPYICAEWEFGGLPYWLLKDSNINLRSYDTKFLEKVSNYYDTLIPKIIPYLSTNDGPVIAMQIENEYGSYGNDAAYLSFLKEALISRGVDVLLFTSDGPTDMMLTGGSIKDVLPTVNFGSRASESFIKLEEHAGEVPHFVMEYWNGWFDHWMEQHHTRDVDDAVQVFKDMLYSGASVNFYMFHGGTNFAFYNGANFGTKYEPTITSYDYDAPLTEAGDITDKYIKLKKVIEDYTGKDFGPLPSNTVKTSYGEINLTEHTSLFDILTKISNPIKSAQPLSMEKTGQDYGFILYRTMLPKKMGTGPLRIDGIGDRAHIFLDGNFIGMIDRFDNQEISITIDEKQVQLDIFVENLGRINYGEKLKDPKGIVNGVRFERQLLFDWEIYNLPLTNIDAIPFDCHTLKTVANHPTFYQGTFHVDIINDTFIEVINGEKGCIFVNGFNIGRYWNVGPQETYYVPKSLLLQGENKIVVFELHAEQLTTVLSTELHRLG